MDQLEHHLDIAHLISLQIRGQLNAEDSKRLQAWIDADPEHEKRYHRLKENKGLALGLYEMAAIDPELPWQQTLHRMKPTQSIRIKKDRLSNYKLLKWTAAAVLIAGIGLGIYYATLQQKQTPSAQQQLTQQDIAPKGSRATLTLSNGQIIVLDSAQQGLWVDENRLTYADGRTTPAIGTIAWSEVEQFSTPLGGQYYLRLPDGSEVWLNAGTTLRIDKMNAQRREVSLEGEAYFEVKTDKQRPFIVQSQEQQIRVLGTKFNISAYEEDQTTVTTLVEGAVQVRTNKYSEDQPLVLHPGEQAQLKDGQFEQLKVDVQSYTAWREGVLVLNQSDLKGSIRLIERWFDVEFDEEIAWPTALKLEGQIPKHTSLSGVLEVLELNTGIQLTVKERRVMQKN